MLEQPTAQFDIDPVGGMGQRIGPQILQDDVEDADQRKPGNEHVERRIGMMGEHLVDNHLEEKRCDQGEDLHEQRGRQDMRDRLAIAPDRGQEPAEAEGLRIVSLAGEPPRDEHGERHDLVEEGRWRQLSQDLRDRIDDPTQSALAPRDEDREAPVVGLDDGRERHARQTLGRHSSDDPRLQSDQLGAADEVIRAGLAPVQRQLARELSRIARDPEKRRDPAQGQQSRVEAIENVVLGSGGHLTLSPWCQRLRRDGSRLRSSARGDRSLPDSRRSRARRRPATFPGRAGWRRMRLRPYPAHARARPRREP